MTAAHISPNNNPYRDGPDLETTMIIKQVIAEVRPYSMVPDPGIAQTIRLTLDAIRNDVPGDLVECGTWLGGCSFAMLLAQRYAFGEIKRPVWMYDSFQGMSEPVAEDGTHARWWRDRSLTVPVDPDGQNYCVARQWEVCEAAERLGLSGHIRIYPGWFHDTMTGDRPKHIAVLRVDCDWYEPCALVYEHMAPRVSVGGSIIIDDFYAWEGCVLATYEYLAKHRLPWMIRSIADFNGAWMIKEKATW